MYWKDSLYHSVALAGGNLEASRRGWGGRGRGMRRELTFHLCLKWLTVKWTVKQRWANEKVLLKSLTPSCAEKQCLMCQLINLYSARLFFFNPMPPKRDAGAGPTQPPVKMIKVGPDAQEFDCDPMEDKYRLAQESSYSPPFPNNEVRDAISLCIKNNCCLPYYTWNLFMWFLLIWQHETIEFDEENIASPGIRTDTISLLMKIEQLQAQLKYERRCRILAERELRELKGGWKKMTVN